MSSHPIRSKALPEPHLRSKQEFLGLADFFKKDEVAEQWIGYLTETEVSLCKLRKGEPGTLELREAIAIGLGLSDELRRFVVNVSPSDAQTQAGFAEVVCAAAGTLIDLCSDRRKKEGGDVAVA